MFSRLQAAVLMLATVFGLGANLPSQVYVIKSVSITGPSRCDANGMVTVSVTVRASTAPQATIKLYEDDVFHDDLIATKVTARRAPPKWADWQETVKITFDASKYEKSKTLELYVKCHGKKSNVIKVKCSR